MGVALAGRRRWIVLVVAVVVSLLAFGVVRALTAGATQEDADTAGTATVDRGDVTTEVATTGTLQAAQTRSLSFAVSGTVESVTVRAGTTVSAGDVLATVDDADADAAEAVEDAETALDEAEDALDEAESASAGGCTGSNVAAAYASPGSASPAPSTSASPSSSPSATARATASPTKKSSRGVATPGATCSAANGGSRSGGDAILSAERRVNQARVTLEKAEEALEGATITAPIAGRVLTVGGKVGSKVSSGSAFITLADVYDMQISADFPEADADHLAVGQAAVITLADRPGETFGATVVQADPVGTSDGTLTRFGVLLSFDESPGELLVGQSASVRVTTGSRTAVVRVPSTAVHDVSGESATVLRNGVPTEVTIGLRGDQYTEIVSGLAEGDVVARS